MYDDIPIITLPESAFGPLGVDLAAALPDAGGSSAQPMFIPILKLTWADERFSCHHVVDAMVRNIYDPSAAQSDLQGQADARACTERRGDTCRADAERRACLFTEPPDAEGWQIAAEYRQLPDGGLCHVDDYEWMISEAWTTGGDA